jgi:hypothetical protein
MKTGSSGIHPWQAFYLEGKRLSMEKELQV